MPMNRRTALAGLTAATIARPSASVAQAFPSKPITFIVPYAPGGFADIRARKIGEKLSQALGVTVVIENKAGAGGTVGTNQIAKAPPDGHTIGMGNFASLAVNVSLMSKLPYDPATDITPIILLEKSPLFLTTSPALGIGSVQELIARAKAEPGKISYGSSGVGGAHHLSAAMFAHEAGIAIAHVPYRGGSQAATDLLAGHIAMMFEMGYAALPMVQANKLKALAVTSSERLALLPDVPTMAEAGIPGFSSHNWQGIIAPKGTPTDIVARLHKELSAILQMPDMRADITSQASEIAGGSPEDFAAFIGRETTKWAGVIKAVGIKVVE